MVKNLGIAFALAILLSLAGCVMADAMPLGNTTYPPRPDDYIVEVYVPDDAPVAVHKSVSNLKSASTAPSYASTIGRVDATGAPAASWGSVVETAKKKARSLGGDAIVIERWGSPLMSADTYGTQHGKSISAKVLRFRP